MGKTLQQQQQLQQQQHGKEPRITLRNYLDMSRSLNVEPSLLRPQKNPARDPRKWDMTKSLNADPGFFTRNTGRGLDSGIVHSVAGANSPMQEVEHPKSGGTRSKVKPGGPLAKSPLADNGFGRLNSKTLPASPNTVSDSPQEKELIEAFVDQLRNIAASSSEPGATTRRVVKKALEFSSHLSAQKAVAVPLPAPPSVMDPGRVNHQHRLGKMISRNANNGEAVSDRRHRRLLPVVEEKQTVISSPIVHTASSITKTKLKSVDMAPAMQEHAIECAFQLLKGMDKLNCKLVAWHLKKEFDKIYGPAWHCIVGTSFGSYVTHSVGGFIYFAVGKVSILLFRTAIEVVDKK